MINLLNRIKVVRKVLSTEKKHIVIATTVTLVAFQTMDRLFATLQLKYPSIKSGSDLLYGAAKDYLERIACLSYIQLYYFIMKCYPIYIRLT